VFNLTNVTKQGDNLFTGTVAGRATGTVKQGELEASAVDPVMTMTHMISSLQTYQAGQNVIQAIDSTMQDSASTVASLTG
jgi:flagellar basal body rod protein FlgG